MSGTAIETVPVPNLSLLLPGGCNARCPFCSWKETTPGAFVERVAAILPAMPPHFLSVSITGGEPMLSPVLDDTLALIDRTRWQRVVLTTNGTAPSYRQLSEVVDHLNISRHHHDDAVNRWIFRTTEVPDISGLRHGIADAHTWGLIVNLNCVLSKWLPAQDVRSYVGFARSVGADSVTFRKPHGPNTDSGPASQEVWCRDAYGEYEEFPCPVCRTARQTIDGFPVKWKSGVQEPSQRLGRWFEAVLHPSGQLAGDWSETMLGEPQQLYVSEIYMSPEERTELAREIATAVAAALQKKQRQKKQRRNAAPKKKGETAPKKPNEPTSLVWGLCHPMGGC